MLVVFFPPQARTGGRLFEFSLSWLNAHFQVLGGHESTSGDTRGKTRIHCQFSGTQNSSLLQKICYYLPSWVNKKLLNAFCPALKDAWQKKQSRVCLYHLTENWNLYSSRHLRISLNGVNIQQRLRTFITRKWWGIQLERLI